MSKNQTIESAVSEDPHFVGTQASNEGSCFAHSRVKTDSDTDAGCDLTAQDATAQLETLRGELDAVDGRLRETLRERLDCCARIGRLKRDGAIPMMQPHRIGIVQQRAAAFAEEHGMSPSFLRAFYDLIITETCRIEDEIIAAKQSSV